MKNDAKKDNGPTGRMKGFGQVKPQKVVVSGQVGISRKQIDDPEKGALIEFRTMGNNNSEAVWSQWLKENRGDLINDLQTAGALLFRDTHITLAEHFQRFCESIFDKLMDEFDRSALNQHRLRIDRQVFNASEYSPTQEIEVHNEFSYAFEFPQNIALCCLEPAKGGGGESTIADGRAILKHLSNATQEKFKSLGVMYVRNYGKNYGHSWQEAFGSAQREDVDNYCKRYGIDHEWKSEDHLRTCQVRSGMIDHPETGESVWFNQAHLFHPSSLDPITRSSLASIFKGDEYPRTAYYGNGETISDQTFDELRKAFRKSSYMIPTRAGDVVILDNILKAHGRLSYRGERKVVVSMANPLKAAKFAMLV